MPGERESNGGEEDSYTRARRVPAQVGPAGATAAAGTSAARHLLEVQVLEGEVSLHDARGFNSGPQNVLLSRNIGRLGYSIQVI